MRILLAGGGTGGHIAPILAVVSELKKVARKRGMREPDFMLITPDEYFKEEIEKYGITVQKVMAGKLRRYFDLKNVSDAFRFFIGIFQSFCCIRKFKPDVVFSKGGFASVPAVISSWVLGIPVVTHESDTVPGLANKINAFFAKKVLVSFYETQKYFKKNKSIFSGNPIRNDITAGNIEAGRAFFGINSDFPTVLIFGGSQGAKKINEAVLDSLEGLVRGFNVIHICGKNNYKEVKEAVERMMVRDVERYALFPFLSSEMKDAYAVTDLIVSRAGANSISEIIAIGKPSVIIPLSTSANGHQEENANWLSKMGLALVVPEKELKSVKLSEIIVSLYRSETKEKKISKNLAEYKKNIKENPAEVIANAIFDSARTV